MASDQLTRIEDKLDENTRQTVENTVLLAEHMRRTQNLEERVAPLEVHVVRMKFLVPLMAALGTGLGLVTSLMHLLGK